MLKENIKMYDQILHMKKVTCVLFFLILLSCNSENKMKAEIEKTVVALDIVRFDRAFAEATPDDLPNLRKQYPYLFPAPDSVWIAKMQDSLQRVLFKEVGVVFEDSNSLDVELTHLFKHIQYYFPEQEAPKVLMVTNDVRYNDRIIFADSLLFISLDNYLGSDHEFYGGFQTYISKGLDKKYIISDVVSAFAKKVIPRPRDKTFLARMIYFGKELYLKDVLIPSETDAIKIGYDQAELDWAKANEEPIWRNFIEQEHLYSTSNDLNLRFLDLTPFSKFGLELDNESPGRLGRYIGWQIVRSFMKRNDNISLKQLLTIPETEIFKKSNYKPKN